MNSRRAWTAGRSRSWRASAKPKSPAPAAAPKGIQLPKIMAARPMNPRPPVWPWR